MDRDSSVAIATWYGMEDPGIEFRWRARFPAPSRSALGSSQPPVPCLFLGAKEAGLGVENPPASRAELEEIGELCIYSTSGPLWLVFLWTQNYNAGCILYINEVCLEINSGASSWCEGNYRVRVSFTWPPLKAALTLCNVKSFIELRKATLSYVMCVCYSGHLSVRMEQLSSQKKDFHEIWYFKIFRKYVAKIQVSLKYDKNNGHFTWTPVYIYDNISLDSSLNGKHFRHNL